MRFLAILLVALVLPLPVLGVDGQDDIYRKPEPPPPPPPPPVIYEHGSRGYLLEIPFDAEVQERPERGDVTISSRRGYVVNVQTGDASPHVPLPSMVARLENQYLGDGKPWSRKLEETDFQLAGLPARNAVYEGSGSRIRVIIARGGVSDFVFMFFAPLQSYETLVGGFDRMLETFVPSLNEGAEPVMSDTVIPRPSLPQGDSRFEDGVLGWSMDHPADWEVVRPSGFAVLFGGKEGTPAFDALVSIQNVRPPDAFSPEEAATKVLSGLKAQLAAAALETNHLGEEKFVYEKGGLRLEGKRVLVEYTDAGRRYRQVTLVLPRQDGPVAHIWSFRAPNNIFGAYWPLVERMFLSWTIIPATRR